MDKYKKSIRLEIESEDGHMIDVTDYSTFTGPLNAGEINIKCDLPDNVNISSLPLQIGAPNITVSFGAGKVERFFAKMNFILKKCLRLSVSQ